MEPMTIEDMLGRMAELQAKFIPLLEKVKADKEEFSQLETAVKETVLSEGIEGKKVYEHGIVKINAGRPALSLIPGKKGSASWDEVATKLWEQGKKRFIRLKREARKNRIKDEMSPEDMKEIGVEVKTEPSVSVEVF